MGGSYLHNIQILRAGAAMAVALAHLRSYLYGEELGGIPEELIVGPMEEQGGIRLARMGVVLFFVISGFLMQRTLQANKHISNFGVSRFFRLVPLYWLSLVIVTVESTFDSTNISLGNFLTSLTFSSQLILSESPINGVGWTLEYETLFYILIGLALAMPKSRLTSSIPGALLVGLMFFGLPPVFIYFLVGQLIYVLHASNLPGFVAPSMLALFLSLGFLTLSSTDPYELQNILFFGSLMGMLLYLAVKLPDLRFQSIETLGNSSCSLYLFHLPVYRIGGGARGQL